MFLFIAYLNRLLNVITPFKYILCSYLSAEGNKKNGEIVIFKYILCSYLSNLDNGVCYDVREFKYILCSYLSSIFIWKSVSIL